MDMHLRRVKNISFFARFYLLGLLFLLNACADIKKATIHDYPKQIAFVFDNKVVIQDPESKKELQEIGLAIDNYWDDSLKVKRIRQFGVFNTVVQPSYFQADKVLRTVQFMQAYLSTKGYSHPLLTPVVKIDTVNEEWRVYLTMNIQLNKKTVIDTVVYKITDRALQEIAIKNKADAYIKKGMAFSNESINNELDRLVELFRSKGYLQK